MEEAEHGRPPVQRSLGNVRGAASVEYSVACSMRSANRPTGSGPSFPSVTAPISLRAAPAAAAATLVTVYVGFGRLDGRGGGGAIAAVMVEPHAEAVAAVVAAAGASGSSRHSGDGGS